jgi:hypothetical protein
MSDLKIELLLEFTVIFSPLLFTPIPTANNFGLPDKTTDHPLAHSWPGSPYARPRPPSRYSSSHMIGPIDHNRAR